MLRGVNMKERFAEILEKVKEELWCVNWSETDGRELKSILAGSFGSKIIKGNKPAICKVIDEAAYLNRFQKSLLSETVRTF